MPLFVPAAKMPTQSYQMGFSGAAAALISNTVAESSLMPTTVTGSKTIPAGWLQAGRTIRVILNGTYTQPVVAGTVTLRVKLGGVTIASGTSGSLLSLATKSGFRLAATFTAQGAGAAVPLLAAGTFDYQGSNFVRQFLDIASANPTIDGTKALDIDVTGQLSVTGASLQTITATIEYLTAQTLS